MKRILAISVMCMGLNAFAQTPYVPGPLVFQKVVALKTGNNTFLTAVNGGGVGGPNSGPAAAPLHSDATWKGAWETLAVEVVDASHVAFKTSSGYYLTAVNNGGIGGPNSAASPFHTDAKQIGPWEKFKLFYDPQSNTYLLQTLSGHSVTVVNNGGYGGPNNYPIHTDATKRGPWETWEIVNVPN